MASRASRTSKGARPPRPGVVLAALAFSSAAAPACECIAGVHQVSYDPTGTSGGVVSGTSATSSTASSSSSSSSSTASSGGGAGSTSASSSTASSSTASSSTSSSSSGCGPPAGDAGAVLQYQVIAGVGVSGDYPMPGMDAGVVRATSAVFGSLTGVAGDGKGNFYVADAGHAVIWKIDAAGNLTQFAGSGGTGATGDGNLATDPSVTMNGPGGVAVDAAGNVYFAEWVNKRVRMVDTAGYIWTYSILDGRSNGLSIDPQGNLYVAVAQNDTIVRLTPSGTSTPGTQPPQPTVTVYAGQADVPGYDDDCPASEATFDDPNGVFADACGNVYVVDAHNAAIRKIDVHMHVSTIAGNGIPGFSGDDGPATEAELDPQYGVVVDAAKNIFISDQFNNRIRRVDGATNFIDTVLGDGGTAFTANAGPAADATTSGPNWLWMDASGALYYTDANQSVYKLSY